MSLRGKVYSDGVANIECIAERCVSRFTSVYAAQATTLVHDQFGLSST